MSSPHIDDALKKSTRLRLEVAGLDPLPPKTVSLRGRVARGIRRVVFVLVVLGLGAVGVFTYDALQDRSPPHRAPAAEAPTYSDLNLFADGGRFAGQVDITNPFDHDIYVIVQVDLYDGDQAVGEISGQVTLRPDSTSRVDLTGFDEVSDYTESRVHLSGFADPAS